MDTFPINHCSSSLLLSGLIVLSVVFNISGLLLYITSGKRRIDFKASLNFEISGIAKYDTPNDSIFATERTIKNKATKKPNKPKNDEAIMTSIRKIETIP